MMKRWGLPFGTIQSGSQTNNAPPLEVPPIITTADAKQFGFENFGNTCYANSVLQALYFCGPFRELVIQYPDPSVPDVSTLSPPAVVQIPAPMSPRPKPSRKMSVSDSPHISSPSQRPSPAQASATIPGSIPIPPAPPTLLSALRSLFVHISRSPADRGTVSPKVFMEKLRQLNELFRGAQHQDAHEFLNFLLNTIVEEMEADRRNGAGEDLSQSIATLSSSNAPTTNGSASGSPKLLPGTLVHRLFEGVLTSETRCLTCETVSSRDESFLDLSIDIEQNSSVTACLRQFSASEMLCQKNKFFCDSCCDLQEAEKRMKIKKLPNVLALHLKRFKYQEDTGRYIKLTYRVAFPYHLRLFNTVDDAEDPDRLYELFAIVVHIGAGPHHGHYVSIIKTRGAWLLFDDDTVEAIKETDIPKYFGDSGTSNGSAYVLYYQAVDLDVAALGVKLVQPAETSNGVRMSSEARTGQIPPDVLKTPLQATEPEHVSPGLPPGLSGPSPLPDSPYELPAPAFTTPSYAATSSTLSTPGTSSTRLSPLVIPNGHNSSSSSGSGIGINAAPAAEVSPDTPTASTSATPLPATPASALGTIMSSLRHTPSSIRVKAGSVKRDDMPPLPPVPSSPTSPVASTSSVGAGTGASLRPSTGGKPRSETARTSSPTTESIESSVYSHMNSKEKDKAHGKDKDRDKDKDKDKSTWFRRKSFRHSRPSTAAGPASAPPIPQAPPVFPSLPMTDEPQQMSATVGYGPSQEHGLKPVHGHGTWFDRKLGRRASEAAFQESPPIYLPTSPQFVIDANPVSAPTSPHPSQTTHLQPVAEHRAQRPDGFDTTVSRSKSSKLPPRPSTAGADIGGNRRPKSVMSPPLPPLPGSPSSPSSVPHVTNGHDQTVPPSPNTSAPNGSVMSPLNQTLVPPPRPPRQPRPHSSAGNALAPSSFGSNVAGEPSGPPVSGTTTTVKKRASRKLSFTAPMLGFGRHKDKER